LLTDMHQPLGRSAGNALEAAEALAFLQGDEARDPRLQEVVLALAGEMLVLGGLARDLADGQARAAAKLADGSAREVFARMVAALSGPTDFADRAHGHLPRAPVCLPCPAPEGGFITRMDTRRIGLVVLALGGGRRHAAADIDPAVGVSDIRGLGEAVARGDPLAMVHAADEAAAAAAIAALQQAIEIGDKAPPGRPVVEARIHRTGQVAAPARTIE